MTKEHGGVDAFFFFRKGVSNEEMKHIATHLECTGFHKDDFGLIIATIFRPESAF